MNTRIRSLKQEYLENLKKERATILEKRPAIVSAKFEEKKRIVDATCKELDEALVKFVREKQEKFNEEVANMKAKIAQKKETLASNAMAESQAEADLAIGAQIGEYDKEIAALEKALNAENK